MPIPFGYFVLTPPRRSSVAGQTGMYLSASSIQADRIVASTIYGRSVPLAPSLPLRRLLAFTRCALRITIFTARPTIFTISPTIFAVGSVQGLHEPVAQRRTPEAENLLQIERERLS